MILAFKMNIFKHYKFSAYFVDAKKSGENQG